MCKPRLNSGRDAGVFLRLMQEYVTWIGDASVHVNTLIVCNILWIHTEADNTGSL